MGISDYKLNQFTFLHQNQPDRPAFPSSLLFKKALDSQAQQLQTSVNGTINSLQSITDGASGADQVAITPINGVPVNSVQSALEYLRGRFDNITLPVLPSDLHNATSIQSIPVNSFSVTAADDGKVLTYDHATGQFILKIKTVTGGGTGGTGGTGGSGTCSVLTLYTMPDPVDNISLGMGFGLTDINMAGDVTGNLLFFDDFNRSDSSSSSLGTAVIGGTWTSVSGMWGISSNQAYSVSDTSEEMTIITTPLGVSNYKISCTMKGEFNASTPARFPGLIVKYNNTSSYVMVHYSLNQLYLYRYGSVITSTPVTIPNNTFFTLSVVCNGANFKVSVDGVQKIDHTLSEFDGASLFSPLQKVGLYFSKAGTPTLPVRYDNFTVESIPVIPTTILFQDDFNRIDNTTSLGMSTSGHVWTTVSSTWGIIGNEAYCTSDINICSAITPALGASNYIVTATVKGDIGNAPNYRIPAVIVKYVNPTTHIRVTLFAGTVYLESYSSGVLTSAFVTTVDNVYYTISTVCNGSNIKVYVDSVLKIDYTMTGAEVTTYGSSQRVGMFHIKSGSPTVPARWENFTVTTL